MKKPKDFNNSILAKHSSITLEGTNNTLYQMAITPPIIDKKTIFMDSLKGALGIPNHINNWYELKVNFGVYERLFQMTIISLCSDIEFMFKELFADIQPNQTYNLGFYQRFKEVIKTLKKLNFDFNDIQTDLENINKSFQIRHISIHNMGYVDESIKNKIDTEYQIDEHYLVTSGEYQEIFESYGNFLKSLDDNLSKIANKQYV